MENIVVKVNGNKAVFEVDLTKEFGLSSSGKSTIVASSQGNQPIPGKPEIKFGLNVYTKA